ncbi:MAG: hypothetical protein U1F06_08680 [Steroidobacteraceae bacterium]
MGDATSWRAGLSWLEAHAADRAYEDLAPTGASVVDAFSGRSRTRILDATLKWAPHGNATRTQLKLGPSTCGATRRDAGVRHRRRRPRRRLPGAQEGWYLQGVYQFRPRWRIGARFDALDPGHPPSAWCAADAPASAFPALLGAAPRRYTLHARLESERVLAPARAVRARRAGCAGRDRQLLLQYLFSIGAHGAHKF